jgi:transcriptional regulator with XRE-family HTH domain
MSIAAFNLIAPPMTPMAPDEKAFCKAMGERIAEARKDHHMTQVQLAELLGVMQQTLAHYEVGRRRVPVSMLPLLATTLAVSVEELIGVSSPAGRRGPAPKLLQQIERIHRLPKARQRFVMEMIDAALQANATADAAE